MDEATLKRMFNTFFTTKAEGMNMGLAISHAIVEAHGGRIWASSGERQGATFHVELPRIDRSSGPASDETQGPDAAPTIWVAAVADPHANPSGKLSVVVIP